MPRTLTAAVHSDLTIKKSRFIGCVQPVADRAVAQEIVAALRAEHPGAVHVCWALLAGGQSAAVDDGEPSGTAGRPMFEVLRHQDLDGVLATVVRYFGGIKLGAGGLIRAYAGSVNHAIDAVGLVKIVEQTQLDIDMDYGLFDNVSRYLTSAGLAIADSVFTEKVVITVFADTAELEQLKDDLKEQFHGKLELTIGDKKLVEVAI